MRVQKNRQIRQVDRRSVVSAILHVVAPIRVSERYRMGVDTLS